jgi:aminoglycoside phosphotransferase family enzyme/predicted kinase
MGDSDLPPAVSAMLDPAFYPDAANQVELVETHVSWVFLAGSFAYKVRKPVVFPFLNYGTPEQRLRMCREEVRLGRRLAPDLYITECSIVPANDRGFALADASAADAVEYAVKMRRFDGHRTLDAMLTRGEVDVGDISRIARLLAAFHSTAERAPEGTFGPADVAATVSENFSTLLPYAAKIGGASLAAGHRFSIAFLHAHAEAIARRSAAGSVRDCHGDLRAEQVILEADAVLIPDPVEFDPQLRLIDVAADLAFLVMDLYARNHEDLARVLVEEYTATGGDYGDEALLYFYAAYRAWVRVKVASLRGTELSPGPEREACRDEARSLALLANQLAWRARRPLVLVVCGLSATGKTLLAGELSARSGLTAVSSDVVRKELAGLALHDRAPESEYSEHASLRTYRTLGARAAAAAARGGAIVDATFRRAAHRRAFEEGYGEAQPAPLFIQCTAPEAVLAERSRRRELDPSRVSDAGPDIVARQARELEPLDEVPADRHFVLRTDCGAMATFCVEAWLDALLMPNATQAEGDREGSGRRGASAHGATRSG